MSALEPARVRELKAAYPAIVRSWVEARAAAGIAVGDVDAAIVDMEPTLDGWTSQWGLGAPTRESMRGGWERAVDVRQQVIVCAAGAGSGAGVGAGAGIQDDEDDGAGDEAEAEGGGAGEAGDADVTEDEGPPRKKAAKDTGESQPAVGAELLAGGGGVGTPPVNTAAV